MAYSRTKSFTAGSTTVGADVEFELDAVASYSNGGIVNADINASAAIALSKLAGRYQYMQVALEVRTGDLAAGWPAAGSVCIRPIVGLTGTGVWTVRDIYWACQDTGAGTGTFRTAYGQVGGALTYLHSAQAINAAEGTAVTGGSTTITFGASPVSLQLVATGVDATCLAGGNNYDSLVVTVNLRRDIQAS